MPFFLVYILPLVVLATQGSLKSFRQWAWAPPDDAVQQASRDNAARQAKVLADKLVADYVTRCTNYSHWLNVALSLDPDLLEAEMTKCGHATVKVSEIVLGKFSANLKGMLGLELEPLKTLFYTTAIVQIGVLAVVVSQWLFGQTKMWLKKIRDRATPGVGGEGDQLTAEQRLNILVAATERLNESMKEVLHNINDALQL